MKDFLKETFTIGGIAIGAMALVAVIIITIAIFMVSISTQKGNYVVIPENGQSFYIKQYTPLSNNTISYIKIDGGYGRISGNFRVEEASTIEKDSK
jgi:hypothetical protein